MYCYTSNTKFEDEKNIYTYFYERNLYLLKKSTVFLYQSSLEATVQNDFQNYYPLMCYGTVVNKNSELKNISMLIIILHKYILILQYSDL